MKEIVLSHLIELKQFLVQINMSYAYELIKHNKILIHNSSIKTTIMGYYVDVPKVVMSQNWSNDG